MVREPLISFHVPNHQATIIGVGNETNPHCLLSRIFQSARVISCLPVSYFNESYFYNRTGDNTVIKCMTDWEFLRTGSWGEYLRNFIDCTLQYMMLVIKWRRMRRTGLVTNMSKIWNTVQPRISVLWILILSLSIYLGRSSDLFPSGFPTMTM